MEVRRSPGDRHFLSGRIAPLRSLSRRWSSRWPLPLSEPSRRPTDVTRLPIGDGHVSTAAKRGYVYACQRTPGRPGGADHAGAWIPGATFDLTAKAVVDGRVSWNGTITFSRRSGTPRDRRERPAALDPDRDVPDRIERRRVRLRSQPERHPGPGDLRLRSPPRPEIATNPSCLPMGMIGIAVNGVAIFNALDDSHRDAVAHETQDLCDGHPQRRGIYHYHSIPQCLAGSTVKSQEQLVGYALDGFPIFGPRGENGKLLTDADLDACHGHTGWITLGGKRVRTYHYHATLEYPYTLGCFRGSPVPSPLAGP